MGVVLEAIIIIRGHSSSLYVLQAAATDGVCVHSFTMHNLCIFEYLDYYYQSMLMRYGKK